MTRHPHTGSLYSRAAGALTIASATLVWAFSAGAQSPAPAAHGRARGGTVTRATQDEVVSRALCAIRSSYVVPTMVPQIEAALARRQRSGDYAAIRDASRFADALTRDLQAATRDKHLVVMYGADPSAQSGVTTANQPAGRGRTLSADEEEQIRAELGPRNFGFRAVSVLDGNVGYLNLTDFAPAAMAWDTAVATMGVLANTDALIIDLRDNGGGSPEMAAVLCTYLVSARFRSVHLDDVYWRQGASADQYWTLPYVPGKLYTGKDVYVLTSARTFSTAEQFAYDLQALKRATVVGERTAGGARLGNWCRLAAGFTMFVPAGRWVNPNTNGSWEGSGVTPDVTSSAEGALGSAHVLALRALLAKATADARRSDLREALTRAQNAPRSTEQQAAFH